MSGKTNKICTSAVCLSQQKRGLIVFLKKLSEAMKSLSEKTIDHRRPTNGDSYIFSDGSAPRIILESKIIWKEGWSVKKGLMFRIQNDMENPMISIP